MALVSKMQIVSEEKTSIMMSSSNNPSLLKQSGNMA